MGIHPNWLFTDGGKNIPEPPALPEYDVTKEAPKFNWTRLWYSIDPVVREPPEIRLKTGGVPKSDDLPDWRGVVKSKVIPMTPPEKYNFGDYTPNHYFWFDTPDYADPFKKLGNAAYLFFKYGSLSVVGYAIMMNHDFNLPTVTYLIKKPLARIWLGGAVASLTVITVANLRGNKDDLYNYAIGGFMAGAVCGRKNHTSFQRQVMMWTPAAMFAKYNAETNGKIIPKMDYRVKNHGIALGSSAEYGWRSGDWRWSYFRQLPDDPGRGLRTHTVG